MSFEARDDPPVGHDSGVGPAGKAGDLVDEFGVGRSPGGDGLESSLKGRQAHQSWFAPHRPFPKSCEVVLDLLCIRRCETVLVREPGECFGDGELHRVTSKALGEIEHDREFFGVVSCEHVVELRRWAVYFALVE